MESTYHSNHIAGNTLTYGETELLLLHDQTHANHTLREYEEMKAHDAGISHLLTLAKDKSRMIGEGDIRNLNKLILKEPFWKPARTAQGRPSRKRIIPGDYKTSPNNVITATGELFEFASPAVVPVWMRGLVVWLETSLKAFGMYRDADLKNVEPRQRMSFNFTFSHYLGVAPKQFDFQTVVQFGFPADHYNIMHDGNQIMSRSYSEPLFAEDIDRITAQLLEKSFDVNRSKAATAI